MPADTDRWLEWAAYNLALGIPDTEVKSEMVKNGFAVHSIDQVMADLTVRPEYKAAQQLARNLKQSIALNDALLELEAQTFDFSRLPRVSNLSAEDFHANYYSTNRPVIIEDVVLHWRATKKWDLQFFRREFGSEQVIFQSGRSRDDHRDSFVDHSTEAPFNVFLDALEHHSADASPVYLIAHDRLLDRSAFRPLLDDIHFDPRYFDGNDTGGRVFFWLGPAGSMTPMHRDLGNVYLAQISGRKLIRLVPSKQLHLMYNECGYHSEADFNDLSLDKFPLLKDANIIEVIVEPGDLLFIPVGWWHFVKALDTSITITGNNFRFPNRLKPIFD